MRHRHSIALPCGIILVSGLTILIPVAARSHDVAGQEKSNTANGITAKASAGLSTPTVNQPFTGGTVYVTVSSDTKHYVALNGAAGQHVGSVHWNMKIKRDSITLDYDASSHSEGMIVLLDDMGVWIKRADLSKASPTGTGSHTASAEAWIDQGTNVSAEAPVHDHPFTVNPP